MRTYAFLSVRNAYVSVRAIDTDLVLSGPYKMNFMEWAYFEFLSLSLFGNWLDMRAYRTKDKKERLTQAKVKVCLFCNGLAHETRFPKSSVNKRTHMGKGRICELMRPHLNFLNVSNRIFKLIKQKIRLSTHASWAFFLSLKTPESRIKMHSVDGRP